MYEEKNATQNMRQNPEKRFFRMYFWWLYIIFTVSKCKSRSYFRSSINHECIYRCLKVLCYLEKLPLALDCGQSKYYLQIYIFSILGVALAVLFLCYFQKLQLLVVKNWNNFCCIVLLFVLRGVFFSRYVQLKSSFPDKKNISGEIWDTPQ